MSFFNSNEALGLPSGSIRAVLVLALTAAAVAMAVRGSLTPEQFLPLVTMALGFYFVASGTQAAANTAAAIVANAAGPAPVAPLAGSEPTE